MKLKSKTVKVAGTGVAILALATLGVRHTLTTATLKQPSETVSSKSTSMASLNLGRASAAKPTLTETSSTPESEWDFASEIQAIVQQGGLGATAEARGLIKEWAGSDLSAAQRWVASYRPGRERFLLMAGVLDHLLPSEPRRASAWFKAFASHPSSAPQVHQIFRHYEAKDREAALAWLSGLASHADEWEPTEKVFQIWGAVDPHMASEALSEMKVNAHRDHAVVGFVKSIAKSDPESAKAWANAIENGEMKQASLALFSLGKRES